MSGAKGLHGDVCVIGDTHGHLQLALCVAARWQRDLGIAFEAVFLCGDVGTFTDDGQLDSTTRRHGKANPCELEFLHQWSQDPQPPWLARIFEPIDRGGLGLVCPVITVHGNHEGFEHLEKLAPASIPAEVVEIDMLPFVDTGKRLRYLPSGWRCHTSTGLVVAGIGGIDRGQRYAKYHDMAYIDEDAVEHLLELSSVDILITHQGPSSLQGEGGSDVLQLLLDSGLARTWFHGHSISNPEIGRFGPDNATLMVPLNDIAFSCKGPEGDDPGVDGWAVLFGGSGEVLRERPYFWRGYRKRKWKVVDDGRLVCPDIA